MALLAREWVSSADPKQAAFERLFMAEYAKVVAIANQVLADRHEAEDVGQEVFYSFYRRHSPDAPYAASWLHRAATHTALNVIRTRKRRERRETAQVLTVERESSARQGDMDPQRMAEEEERRAEVRSALTRLPKKSGSVLALRYSGLSYAEVAAALGIGIGQVGTLLRRAEAALLKEMNHEASE